MESDYLILIYSKYSEKSKELFRMVNSTQIELPSVGINLLCVDNKYVRNAVINNKKLNISQVPCIIRIMEGGTVEKYESNHCFQFIENLLNFYIQQNEKIARENQLKMQPKSPEPEQHKDKEITDANKIPKRMKMIDQIEEKLENDIQGTNIDDIVLDDSDRHKNKPPPKRIRQDESGFVEDDNLFSGDPVEHRREPSNTTRMTSSDKKLDPHNIRAKAEELARGRDEIEQQLSSRDKNRMSANRTA
jgi:hypothetical protein